MALYSSCKSNIIVLILQVAEPVIAAETEALVLIVLLVLLLAVGVLVCSRNYRNLRSKNSYGIKYSSCSSLRRSRSRNGFVIIPL